MTTLSSASTRPHHPVGSSWPWAAGLVLSVLGIADAVYLTYAHYTAATVLSCPDKGFINCAKVTTSSYSHFLGMPVAVLGLVFFVVMLPLQSPWAWASHNPLIRVGRVAMVSVGMLMVLWLLYAELVKLDNLCIYCTGVHILTFLLFLTTVFGTIATGFGGVEPDEQ